VDDGSVLHIDTVTDADAVHVATQHRIEPDAAFVSEDHIAAEGGIGRYETAASPGRADAVNGKEEGHVLCG
jgi:hypothetical protein